MAKLNEEVLVRVDNKQDYREIVSKYYPDYRLYFLATRRKDPFTHPATFIKCSKTKEFLPYTKENFPNGGGYPIYIDPEALQDNIKHLIREGYLPKPSKRLSYFEELEHKYKICKGEEYKDTMETDKPEIITGFSCMDETEDKLKAYADLQAKLNKFKENLNFRLENAISSDRHAKEKLTSMLLQGCENSIHIEKQIGFVRSTHFGLILLENLQEYMRELEL